MFNLNFSRTRRGVVAAVASSFVCLALASCGEQDTSSANGGDWSPERPITIIVPASPGGGSDQMARAAVDAMEKEDPQAKFVVENVSGGGGAAGIAAFLKRPTDGYTFLQVPAADVSLLLTQGQVDATLDDFEMVGRMQSGPAVVMGSADDSRFGTYEEMISYMQESGESLNAAMYIPQGFDDLTLRAIEEAEGVEFTRVPYTEAGERFTALLSGRADVLLQRYGDIKQYIESGDMVPLVTDFAEQPEGLESVPTFNELGIEFNLDYSRGFWAHAEAPAEAVAYMQDLVEQAATSEEWIKSEAERGYIDGYLGPDEWRSELEEGQQTFDEAYGG